MIGTLPSEEPEPVGARYRPAFDRLFERGRAAVLSGSHFRDVPPVEGGRWGVSVVFIPDAGTAARLERLTRQVMVVAGAAHWPTGFPAAVHFTVRAIEAHRVVVPADDPLVARCVAALTRAAARSRPVRLRLDGLTLTPSGVMVCAYPTDSAAKDFATYLGAELGADAWFEANFDRNIWYATLVHFTASISDAAALVDWVAARRDGALGEMEVASAELVRFWHNGHQPVRRVLAAAPLSWCGGCPGP